MAESTLVATANVLCDLPLPAARAALELVLEQSPDLVGLQEWSPRRAGPLWATGSLGLVPPLGRELRPRLPGRVSSGSGYLWSAPLVGGCVVGARADRYELVEARSRAVSLVGRGEHPQRWWGIEPPRLMTLAVYRDLRSERVVSVVCFHLTPGVQARGRYRDDRPRLAARHRHEVRRLQQTVDDELARGRVVFALGDSNFDGLRLAGVVSAWTGREERPGTLGRRRKVDDVHGPGPAESVTTLDTLSDHKVVLVRRWVCAAKPQWRRPCRVPVAPLRPRCPARGRTPRTRCRSPA
jgi:hypothetical protein